MDGIIDKALKACGKASEPQASPPPVSTTAQPGSPEWARASDACPRPYNFVADENDKWTCIKETGSASPCPLCNSPQALPRVGKDCSGIPLEKRTLDCALAIASPSWASRPDVSPEAKASILARARWEIVHGASRERWSRICNSSASIRATSCRRRLVQSVVSGPWRTVLSSTAMRPDVYRISTSSRLAPPAVRGRHRPARRP